MSEPRKSAIQTEARRRAREKAAEFRAREDKLEALAVEYFVANTAIETIEADLERAIAALRERASADAEKARTDADNAVQAMLALKVPRAEVASRLGVPTRQIKATATGPSDEPGHVAAEHHSEDETHG